MLARCGSCNKEFIPNSKLKSYCSKECQFLGKRKHRRLYQEKMRVNRTQATTQISAPVAEAQATATQANIERHAKERATETQTDIIASIDNQGPFVFDARDCIGLFSDWKSLREIYADATGRALKYIKNNGRWSLASWEEVWKVEQWDEWHSNCQSHDVAYVLTGVEMTELYASQLRKNNILAAFTTGGSYCLSHYKKSSQLDCFNIAPSWGNGLIWQWQGERDLCLSMFIAAHGARTIRFTCFPRKGAFFQKKFRKVVKKYSHHLSEEIGSKNQIVPGGSSDWKEKVLKDLAEVHIYPTSVDITLGQAVIIPPGQSYWYTYCEEGSDTHPKPLILLSARGDYVGHTTESFEEKFWDLMDSSADAADVLFSIVYSFCQLASVSAPARNHAAAALKCLDKLNLKDDKRNKWCRLAQSKLNQQSNSNSMCLEESSIASGHEEISQEQSGPNKRKIEHDPSDEPPSKKFRSDTRLKQYINTIESHGHIKDEFFQAYLATLHLPESITVLPLDTWKSRPTNLVATVKEKQYAVVPLLDHCSLMIFVDLQRFLTKESTSCNVMYFNSLCQRINKADVVSFLGTYTDLEPSWQSIKLVRINSDWVDRNLSILALIRYLELFAAKPFASKEELTKEEKLKWKKVRSADHFRQYFIARIKENGCDLQAEAEDTENDEDSL